MWSIWSNIQWCAVSVLLNWHWQTEHSGVSSYYQTTTISLWRNPLCTAALCRVWREWCLCDTPSPIWSCFLSLGSRTEAKQQLAKIRRRQPHTEGVYFIVRRLGHDVTVNKATWCICHNLFPNFCLKVSVSKRGLNSEGTVQKQVSRWMAWRGRQVPTDHVTHLLGGMQPFVNWAHAKAPESVARTGRGGGGQLRTWSPMSSGDHLAPLLVLAKETSLAPIQTGCKVICAPCVRRWFHQAVVG